jgi:hypothetical protein
MGAAIGGSIESLTIRNRLFPVAADAEASRKLGGFENEVSANGDGGARLIKTRVPWSLTGVEVEVNDSRADAEFLKEIADGHDFVPITITFVSGITYQADGQITDALEVSSQKATAAISLMGPGEMTQQ